MYERKFRLSCLSLVTAMLLFYGCAWIEKGSNLPPDETEAKQYQPKPYQQGPVPEVFHTKFYQSPVRGEPDDLLLIPGYGFAKDAVAVYQAVSDKPTNPKPPITAPASNTSSEGYLYVANVTPDSITVLLPEVMKSKQPYAIWVKNPGPCLYANPASCWSEPVFINDPRPLWVTPDVAYKAQPLASSLPREIKVVGRNLNRNNFIFNGGISGIGGWIFIPIPGWEDFGHWWQEFVPWWEDFVPRQIRLLNSSIFFPDVYTLTVTEEKDPDDPIEHYVARAALPPVLEPGVYIVQYSRDGTNWIDLPKEVTLTVSADPQEKKPFDISDVKYGGCKGDDQNDDTGCLVKAIAAASANGGGEVRLPSGTWYLKDPSQSKALSPTWYNDGIVIPQGVDLVGAGATGDKPTKVVQTLDWTVSNLNLFSVFTLQGNNRIQGIYFHSDGFKEGGYPVGIGLGKAFPTADDPKITENVVITDNKFSGLNNGKVTGMYFAIADWGQSVRRLFIVHNEFQAYRDDLLLAGGAGKHSVQDSVIAHNTFYPGDYEVPPGVGTIASEMDGFRRSDFSDNVADGHVNGGWRAAYFWSTYNANGPMLISRNKAICTGNKMGDGESIVIDENGNIWGFKTPQKVVAATPTSVSVNGEWAQPVCGAHDKDNNCTKWTEEPPGYYSGHSVNIVDGKGLGQTRKITGYQDYTQPGPWVFTVSPAWDVIPDKTSVVTVKRSNWNVYMVDNVVDNRGCKKSDLQKTYNFSSGTITWWAEASDWAIEGNRLYDSAGILVLPSHQEGAGPGINNGWNNFAGEVRNNLVDGEDKCPASHPNCVVTGGIRVWYGGPPDSPSVVEGYNLLISHNTVTGGASDVNLGAISVRGQPVSNITPYQWKGVSIFHNTIEKSPSYGININESHVWDTVLYKNNFKDNKLGEIFNGGTNTVICSAEKVFCQK